MQLLTDSTALLCCNWIKVLCLVLDAGTICGLQLQSHQQTGVALRALGSEDVWSFQQRFLFPFESTGDGLSGRKRGWGQHFKHLEKPAQLWPRRKPTGS